MKSDPKSTTHVEHLPTRRRREPILATGAEVGPDIRDGRVNSLRRHIHRIIFEADTPIGKAFDIALLVAILMSVLAVSLESVNRINQDYGLTLRMLEWTFTILFTVEYLMRLWTVARPWRYALSFYGLVDLLAILPTYLALIFAGTQTLSIIRVLRLLRVFRVFKLARYLGEAGQLFRALRASRFKITVFFVTVLIIVTVIGTVMFLVEGNLLRDNPGTDFTSIPRSIYWAIVTLTTVGYGDVVPKTDIGRTLAAFVMILGYAIIAVPTGIVSAEIARATRERPHLNTRVCGVCSAEGHDDDAIYCKACGASL